MPVQQATAKLSEREQLNEKYLHLFYEMVEPNQLEFEAGQYVSVAIPGDGNRRSYSIASEPDKKHAFELLLDLAPQGIGTKYLQAMKPGEDMSILAPMGVFTLAKGEQAAQEKALMFIATGSGIAPLRSMILDLLHRQQDTREIWLYWGMRYEYDLFWTDEFHQLEQAFPNFHFHLTLSQAGQEWPLCRGRVTDCLRIHNLPAEAGYYLCGNNKMIEEVMHLLTTEKSVPETFIHREQFY